MIRSIAAVAATTAAIAGTYVLYSENSTRLPGLELDVANAQDAAEIDTSKVVDMSLGNPDAPVTVIEYASFTCPHCANFHDNVFGELKANYIDTDKINFIYREVYFDRFGLWAGMLARCGDGTRYFGISDMLYEKQREWIGEGQPAEIAENLRTMGKTAGLSEELVNECLSDQAMAEAMIAVYQENAERDDINSTPSFIINGEKYSNMNYADFSAVLDEKLADAN